jgi:DHA2 family lincomycin resistance protein-like MFS transporter
MGGVLLASALLLGLLLINGITAHEYANLTNLIFLILFVVTLTVFVRIETNRNEPLLRLEVFKQKKFLVFLIPFFLLQLGSLGMSYLIPNVLELGFNQNTNIVGIYVAPAAIVDALAVILGGYLYDRFKHSISILSGVVLILLTFLGLVFLKANPVLLAIMYGLFMLGLGLSYSNIMTFSLSKISKEMVNDGNAIFMTAQSYAGAIGIALSASIMAAAQNQKGLETLRDNTLIGLQLNAVTLIMLSVITFILLWMGFKEVKD